MRNKIYISYYITITMNVLVPAFGACAHEFLSYFGACVHEFLQKEKCWIIGYMYLHLQWIMPNCLTKWFSRFSPPPSVYGSYCCCLILLIFDIVRIVHLCQRCVVVACGGFDLHFSDSNEIGHPFSSPSLFYLFFWLFGFLVLCCMI